MEETLRPNSQSTMQSAMAATAPPFSPGPLPPSPAAFHRHRPTLRQRLMMSRLLRQFGEQGLRRPSNRFPAHGTACAPSPTVPSPIETRALSGTPPSYTCRVTTSRQPLSTTVSTSPHMTIDSCGRRVQQQPKLMTMMEALVPSPARLEVTPTSEAFGTGGQEAYAASPNSLYMYEQEKHDMLSFDPINPAVPSPTLLSQVEEFDLKPQFENSNTLDISNMTPANGSFQTNGTSAQALARDVWRGKTMASIQDAVDTGLRMDKAELGQEPTLNELNLDDSLLDELNLESLLQNVDTSVFASGAPSPMPDSKPASGVATPLQDGCGPQTPLMTVAAVTRALDSFAGMDSGSSSSSSQPAAVSSKSLMSAQPSPPTYSGSFTCQPIKREPYDPEFSEYETGRSEDKTLLHRLLLQGRQQTQMQQQKQLPQMPLPQQSFQSQKSVPPTSTSPSSSSSSPSSSALPPLKFRSSQNSSFQPLSPPLSNSRPPTAPRLKFSPSSASAPTVVKQEASPCSLNVLRGSGHVSFPSSSSSCQQQQAASSSRSSSRGVKRTLSALEGEDSQNTMERKWREIEQFIHDPETAEADLEESMQQKMRAYKKVRHASANSARTSSIEASSEVDTDDDDDDDSDNDLDSDLESISEMGESLLDDKTTGSGKKKERQYFWQYNVQAKGPKGTRLRLLIDNSNPHKVHKFEDPVFDPENTMVAGIRHGGKARKGDGNEVTPNPTKFYHIGLQIRRLNRQINDLGNANDLPAPQRNSSRKLKNKLASRACRLKKKAQHEANKVKLFGLNMEHKRMMYVLQAMEQQLVERAAGIMKRRQAGAAPMDSSEHQKPLTAMLEELVQTHLTERVAGNGTDYVNSVITKVEKGDPTGGLNISKSKG